MVVEYISPEQALVSWKKSTPADYGSDFAWLNALYKLLPQQPVPDEFLVTAKQTFNEYCLRYPSEDAGHHHLAMLYNEFYSDFERAEKHARKVIALNPAHPRGYFQLAVALHEQDDLAGCIAALEQVTERDPYECFCGFQALSLIHDALGQARLAALYRKRHALAVEKRQYQDISKMPLGVLEAWFSCFVPDDL